MSDCKVVEVRVDALEKDMDEVKSDVKDNILFFRENLSRLSTIAENQEKQLTRIVESQEKQDQKFDEINKEIGFIKQKISSKWENYYSRKFWWFMGIAATIITTILLVKMGLK